MKISLIADSRIEETKGGWLSHVDDTLDVPTLRDLGEVICAFHFAPGTFKENVKRQSHLESIELLCFDFDNGLHSSESVHNQLLSMNHLIVGSKNHLKDKGDGKGIIERFHVFIPLDRAVTSVDFYKFISKKFATLRRWHVDNTCLEPARYFYKHSKVLYAWEGQLCVSVSQYEKIQLCQAKIDQTKRDYFTGKIATGDAVEKFKHTRYWSILTGELSEGEGRYSKRCRIAGGMKACGVDVDQAVAMFQQYDGFGGKFTESTLRRLF